MSTTRRSRMRRMRRGKPLAITSRDIAIFHALSQYRYLRSTYLHAFAGGASRTRFKERLGDLFHEGYLDRPEAQWRFADARYAPAVYELGHGAAHVLAELGPIGDDRRIDLSTSAQRQYLHSVMVCEIVASIELTARTIRGLRFVPWPEILAKAPKSVHTASFRAQIPVGSDGTGYVVPDAIFGLEYDQSGKKAYRFCALEADRGTMPVLRHTRTQTSYLGKLAAYRQMLANRTYRSHLGVPNFLVLTVTTSEARMNTILSAIDPVGADTAGFLVKSAGGLSKPSTAFLYEPWDRAGQKPLDLSLRHVLRRDGYGH